ncbi:MAG TPA: hypothetical protein VLF94_07780 [Chlamydiales bacterium]|nr:hypothetical protein [Chlamydiales bacterium]
MKKWVLVAILFLREMSAQSPWLTGPLIAPTGTAVPYGDVMVKSYLYVTTNTGSEENFYTINAQVLCFFGLTPWCDLNVIPQVIYNTTSHQHSVHSGDLTVGLDFQLMAADFTPYFPGIKFAVREVLPTGNFQRFSPRKLGTDQTGGGTFATQLDLVLYKVFHLSGLHWLSTTFSTQYTINTPVDVHGFNAYGGGFGANGTALPGNSFQGIVSFELSLNQNWVLALDNVYTQTNATPFFGIPGIAFTHTFADVGKPSSEQFSFAPAIEYNLSSHFGIIAGCWFSAWGRNRAPFRSGVVNFDYVY